MFHCKYIPEILFFAFLNLISGNQPENIEHSAVMPEKNQAHSTLNSEHDNLFENQDRVKRTLYISALALINAILVGFIAKALLMLINVITSLSFYGTVSLHEVSPAGNKLGWWVVAIPVIGGLIVGIMARFGSRAIRGHGIPEAMEKIVKEQSKIHPIVTILKPLSSAISIGTGGPFGAEGPIISTGGALGSFCGQTLRITAQERKILLAAGATAGMTAIFGTPFAAILLAIELLLFEFSARSFIPVIIACITGACMHFLLFGIEPMFPMPHVEQVKSTAVVAYAIMGLIIGVASIIVTKAVYFIEDTFEKLPVHWMWWPAIGGLAVGIIGYFSPFTLGVGYENITHSLSGEASISILISLCLWKFISWAISLGSGTSGGTLAPLLTIGSSLGCLLGILGQQYFPDAHISLPLAALVGMSALFAGAARALLTSIVFAMETTMQESTLLPLLAGCVTSYLVSFIFMRSTIMTEKINRRGVSLPESYHPDVLELTTVSETMGLASKDVIQFDESMLIKDLKTWLQTTGIVYTKKLVLISGTNSKTITGAVNRSYLFESDVDESEKISTVMNRRVYSVYSDNSLQIAVEFMLKTKQDTLLVIDRATQNMLGVITEHDVLKAFEQRLHEERHIHQHISMKKTALKVMRKGTKIFMNRK